MCIRDRNICAFLDINQEVETHSLNQKIHKGIRGALPLELRSHLYKLFGKEIQDMANNGIVYAHKWLAEHDEIMKGKAVRK